MLFRECLALFRLVAWDTFQVERNFNARLDTWKMKDNYIPVIRNTSSSHNDLKQKYLAAISWHKGPALTSPLLLGIMYVKPDSVTSVFPNLTHGALTRTVCPLTGYIALSSTPPKNLAPRPTATTTASGGGSFAVLPENRLAPPSIIWWICCADPRRMRPPFSRKLVRR